MMKRVLSVFGLLGLSACAPAPSDVPTVGGVRDTAAQIASQTDVTAQRMAGNWVIRQGYAALAAPARRFQIEAIGDEHLRLVVPATEGAEPVAVTLQPAGPGRWRPVEGAAFTPDVALWVLWMDFDSRTAAIGTPTGRIGWIMDRRGTGGEDRIAAAREIMAWFGYDMESLMELSR